MNKTKICGDNICLDDQQCIDNACVDKSKVCGDRICTENETCIANACVNNTKICGDNICTDTQTCVNNECIQDSKICGDKICQNDEICINNDCVPGGSVCGVMTCDPNKEECVDGNHCEPIDPCRGIVCTEDGQKCDGGTCRDRRPCEDIQCNDGKVCAVTLLNPLGECIDNGCAVDEEGKDYKVEKTCGENQMCVNGTCTDDGCIVDGVPKTCEEGWECIKGNCEETACIGKTCDDGRTCVAGNCYDDECLPLDEHVCEEGKTCSKGDCIYDKCVGVECKQGKVCTEDGTCQFETDPAIVSGKTDDPTTDESGKTTSIPVSLNHEPAADVTFTCEILPADSADEASIDCSSLVLNSDNWSDPQNITVTGNADHIVDGDQEYTVKITSHSDDPEFDGLTFETDTLTNVDVDKAGINPVNADDLMTNEDGTTATFELSLTTKPSAPVTITVSSDNTGEGIVSSVGTVSGNQITIQPEDWDKPISVVITGVDDNKHDPDTQYNISFEVSSEDKNYDGIEVPEVTITNGDNDKPNANFSKTELKTDETPTSSTFTFNLATAPKADVHVTITVTVNGKPITLTGKYYYIFIDIFDYVDFDLNDPKGKSIVTIHNGQNAKYMGPLNAGDVLEIYWKD